MLKIFIIFAMGLMWINYPQTAEARTVAPSFFYVHHLNTCDMQKINYKKGQKLGELIYVKDVDFPKKGRYAIFVCECGNECIVDVNKAKSGHTKSCGCKAHPKGKNSPHWKGCRNHPYYSTYSGIKTRCYNKKAKQYNDYGGRGIKMYTQWKNDFVSFAEYIEKLKNYGKKGYTLDRINNNGNYEPDNIKFSTRRQQILNSRLRKTNKSGYKNICFHKQTNKWCVRKNINGKRIWVGVFNSIEDAKAKIDTFRPSNLK